MFQEKTIIKDLRVLTEHFIPRRIIHREGQMLAIRDNLKPLVDGEIPRNSFLYGSPGTGKTCLSLYVVDELKAEVSVLSVYNNCWSYPSRFKILYNIAESLGSNFLQRKGTPTDELIDVLKARLRNKHCIIILDEADQLEDDKILYDLLEMEGVCLILIANSQTIFYNSDPRIRSRMHSLDRIEFRAYSTSEIADILKDRVEYGLVPGTIDNQQITRIAEVGGDARAALNILRAAAELAEKQDVEKITNEHIEKAIPRTVNQDTEKLLDSLNAHQKVLYEIIKSSREIPSADLHSKFEALCKEKSLETVVDRTTRKYLERLEFLGLISVSGDGRWTVYKIVI